jgi:hypothetical protein
VNGPRAGAFYLGGTSVTEKLRPRFFYLAMVPALALSARAGSVIYSFTYTPTSGPFPSTTFQLVEPNFLGAGTYSITPFTMSDGSVTYGFTQLNISTFESLFCLAFGTSSAYVLGTCSAAVSPDVAPDASMLVDFQGSVPSAPGAFSS